MAGWDYIIGETGYNQPFVLFDNGTNGPVDGTGISAATMTIRNTDLSFTSPAITDIALSVDTANPLKIKLLVNSATPNVPQTTGQYLVTFTVTIGSEVRKTFELDLRVFNG
jgi:hypothetical protein